MTAPAAKTTQYGLPLPGPGQSAQYDNINAAQVVVDALLAIALGQLTFAAYNAGTSYTAFSPAALDVAYLSGGSYSMPAAMACSSGGNIYLCIAPTTGNPPPNSAFWRLTGPLSATVVGVTPASIGAVPTSAEGAANGVATLGSSGQLPTGQLPAHASTHASAASDPITPAAIGAVPATAVGAASGVAALDSGGHVPLAQIPSLSLSENPPVVVASQAAMLALSTATVGQVAIRTDINETFMLAATPPATLANWTQLLSPTGAVASVDGLTGAVVLSGDYAAIVHAAQHASGGADPVTPAAIGAAPADSGVTNGNSHAHASGDGAPIAYANLTGAPALGTGAGYNAPASGNASSGQVVLGSDTRLTNARAPTSHATTHEAAGSDAIPLDTLAAPTDNTNLNVSPSAHGLAPKLTNTATKYLRDDGTWVTPPGSTGPGTGDVNGPASSTAGDIAVFADASGEILSDSGVALTALAPASQGVTSGNSHKHHSGDGGTVAYGDLSGLPTLTPAAIGAVATAAVGVASGVPSLDSGGHVPVAQLPSSVVGALEYQGAFDCSGGSYPASPSKGYYYVCSVAGTISGTAYAVGDWLIYNGSAWERLEGNPAPVTSVCGKTGAVTLGPSDVGADASGAAAAVTAASIGAEPIPATAISGNLASFNGSKQVVDSAIAAANVVTEASAAAAAGNVVTSAGATKVVQDSGVALANIPTMASAAAASGNVITSAGANKTQQDSGTALSNLVLTGDTRMTNARTPTAHQSTHETGGSDVLALPDAIEFVIDGSGTAIATGMKGYLQVDFPCTIQSVTLLCDQTGSVEVDIWACSYANFAPPTHPATGDTITASDKPTISSGVKYTDSTLTGWTTSIAAGTILGFDVVSCTTCTRVTVVLKVVRA